MDFVKFLKKSAKEIDRETNKILKQQLKEANKIDKKLVPLLIAFIASCQGGKGIRGVLVRLGYEIGKQPSDSLKAGSEAIPKTGSSIIKVAAAYEILHSAILIHDDVIDKSSIRRDKPSLYKQLGGNHYGVSQAISLGDYGFFLATKVISGAGFSDKNKNKALELFSQVMLNTACGEMLDLEETDPWVVMKLKTACYTISGPLQLGGTLAGAEDKLLGQLGQFGEKLGMAYQIRDDILDKEIDYLGSAENAEKEVKKYTNQAMKIIPDITKDKIMSKILEQMGEYLVQREK